MQRERERENTCNLYSLTMLFHPQTLIHNSLNSDWSVHSVHILTKTMQTPQYQIDIELV